MSAAATAPVAVLAQPPQAQVSQAQATQVPPPRAPGASQRVVAFVTDDQSEAALRAGLVEFTSELDIRRGSVPAALKFLERESRLRVLLVDLTGLSQPIQALDDLAHVCPPDVIVLAIGATQDIALYRALVHEMGVADYLPKPLTRDIVAQVFGPHVAGTELDRAVDRGGRVVLVCGARGGVGTTTVAVSLATLLARDMHSHVALLDMHLHRGTVALMAGIKTGSGLRIALEDPQRVDALFLERAAVAVDERLRVVAADEPLAQGVQPTEEGVARVIDLLRKKFNFIVIDLPMPPPAAARRLIALARTTVLVLRPDVASLRDGVAIRQFIAAQSHANQVVTVVNHATMAGALAPPMLESSLGGRPDIVIPEFGKAVVAAANLGKPAARQVPALARALSPLVQEVSGGALASVRRSWLTWWRKR